MEDMIIIEGAKALDPKLFTKFCSYLNSDDEEINVFFTNESISTDPRVLSCKRHELIDTAFGEEVKNYCVNTDDEVLVQCEKAVLRFVGQDVQWYAATTRRLNKLKNAVNENYSETQEKEVKAKKASYDKTAQYSVAIAELTEEGLTHIDFIQGTKGECLKFLNDNIIRHTDLSGQSVMVFNLNFKQEDTEDLNKWKTLEELQAENKVALQ